MMDRKRSIFKNPTLLELGVVIVVLVVASSAALASFVDLQNDARCATLDGIAHNMQTTNRLIYTKAVLTSAINAGPSTLETNSTGTSIEIEYGYAKSATELAKAMGISDSMVDMASETTQIRIKGGSDASKCSVTYGKATAIGSEPSYTVEKSGC